MKCLTKWKGWLYVIGLFFMGMSCLGCRGMTRSLASGGSMVMQDGSTQDMETSAETGTGQQSETAEEGGATQGYVETEVSQAEESLQDAEEDSSIGDAAETSTFFVHVCGCVKEPGLYEFPGQTRAGDAIDQAGGFTKKADQTAVNLAQILSDGMQLYIPAQGEAGETPVSGLSAGMGSSGQTTDTPSESRQPDEAAEDNSGTSAIGLDGKVNINEATAEDLMTLSGIGKARAEAILSYRSENGSFSSIEDIKNVSGIGEGIFDKIKDKITV